MKLINEDELVKAIENENSGLSISGAVEKFARIAQVKMQPAIDAIPVEWILNHPKFPHKNEDRKKCILDMIEDWRKENERI